MDIKKTLSDIGLNEGEIKVYLALLKLGSVQVSKLKEETNLHRTTIYDFIEKLLNKGLVNYVVRNNIKYFSATNPEKLLEYIKEKEESIKDILPSLKEMSQYKKEAIKVEVYKGLEGLKTILNNIIKTKKELVGFSLDDSEFEKRLPVFMEQFFRREKELGIGERLLTSKNAKHFYKNKNTHYGFIDEKYFNPNPTLIYGNKIANIIWEPLTTILIENNELADSYRKHFELLWKIAKK